MLTGHYTARYFAFAGEEGRGRGGPRSRYWQLMQDLIAVQPFGKIVLAATGNAGKLNSRRTAGIGPNNFAQAFDDRTRRQLEAKSNRRAGLKKTKRTDGHPVFT